jgi:putative aldouronate transport system permease protein
MKRKFDLGEILFGAFVYIFLAAVVALTLYPVLYVLSASVSSSDAVVSGKVVLFPKELTLDAYRLVLSDERIWTAYGNSVFYTAAGVLVNLLFTVLAAYPLSKKRLAGRTALSVFFALTMWFNAGIITTFLNFKSLNLIDSRASIIIGFACSAFYVIMLRTFFQSVPEALEESAKIDGANDYRVLWDIMLPISTPALLTIGLYYAVDRWNGYFWAMALLKSDAKMPLQVLLKKLIVEMSVNYEQMNAMDVAATSKETVTYATIIVSIVPILVAYPYVQKFFVKGVMVGSVKG